MRIRTFLLFPVSWVFGIVSYFQSLQEVKKVPLLVATWCQHSEAGLEGGKSPPAWSKSIWLFIVSHVIKRPLVYDSSEVKKGLHLLKNIERDSCMCQVRMKAFISVSLLSVIFQNSLVSRCAFGRIKHEHLSWITFGLITQTDPVLWVCLLGQRSNAHCHQWPTGMNVVLMTCMSWLIM